MKPESKKLLEELPRTTYGKALQEYLDEEVAKIDTVKGAKGLSHDQLVGREIALEIVEKLFYFMGQANPQPGKGKISYS